MEIVIIKIMLMTFRKYRLGRSLGTKRRRRRNNPKVIH